MKPTVSSSGASRSRRVRRLFLSAVALCMLVRLDHWLATSRGFEMSRLLVDLGQPVRYGALKIDDHHEVTRHSVVAMLTRLSERQGFVSLPEGRQTRFAQSVAELDAEYRAMLWYTFRLIESFDAQGYARYQGHFSDPLAMGNVVRTDWRWFREQLQTVTSNGPSLKAPTMPADWKPENDPQCKAWQSRYVDSYVGLFREDPTLRTQSKVLLLALPDLQSDDPARGKASFPKPGWACAVALCSAAERLEGSWNLLLEWLNEETTTTTEATGGLAQDAGFLELAQALQQAHVRTQSYLHKGSTQSPFQGEPRRTGSDLPATIPQSR